MYSIVRRGAGREVQHGTVERSSGWTKESLFKEEQIKDIWRQSRVEQAGPYRVVRSGWCVIAHDQEVLPAVLVGGHKFQPAVE